MKFSDRSPKERTAIQAWIRVMTMARENACLDVPDGFRHAREGVLSASPELVAKMVQFYAAYQQARPSVSYADYFQVSNPEEYAAILEDEKKHPPV